MKRLLIGGVVGGLVALGWWAWSDDAVTPSPADAQGSAPAPSAVRHAAPLELDDRPPNGQRPGTVEPASVAPSSLHGSAEQLPPGASVAEIEAAESPFASSASPEIDYAFELLYGPDAGPHTFGHAADSFERCVKDNPRNERCQLGLLAAQRAFHSGDAGWLDSVPPPDFSNARTRTLERPRATPLTDSLEKVHQSR